MITVPALLLSVLSAQPNVVFIAVDDLRPDLGCAGVEWAQTPNIDRLANSGVFFSRHYVQVPTCGASRYALLTGRCPEFSGVTRSNSAFSQGPSALSTQVLPGAQSFPEMFRRDGYRTICIGKISHTVDNRVFAYDGSGDGRSEVPHAWNDVQTPFGDWHRGWGAFFAYPNGVHREDGSKHRPLTDFTVESDEDLPDGLIAANAVQAISELALSDQPYLLAVGFYKPHLPWVAPRSDWEATEPPPLPEVHTKVDSAYWRQSGEFFNYQMRYKRPLNEEEMTEARRAYAACVRYTDRQVGKVLDAIEQSGEKDNTVIVLWGDHGWQLGDWGLWGKHTPLEASVSSPLIISIPDAGTGICNVPTETLDIYPTLVEACDLKFRQTVFPLDGESLLKRMKDPAGKANADDNDVAISFWNKAVSVRSRQFRAIGTPSDKGWKNVELYEPESDYPAANVANRYPGYAHGLLRTVPDPTEAHKKLMRNSK